MESSWFLLGNVEEEYRYILIFPRPGGLHPGSKQTLHPIFPETI